MAMNKKEKSRMEELLTIAALRYTADAGLPDIPIPDAVGVKTKGYLLVGVAGTHPGIEFVESESVCHATFVKGVVISTPLQGGRALYSTRIKALQALRNAVEKQCAQTLRRVEVMIEEESESILKAQVQAEEKKPDESK